MATVDPIPDGTAKELLGLLSDGTLKFLMSLRSTINKTNEEKTNVIDDPTADNIVTVTEDGDIQDSGYDLPDGNIVGDTDTQTLTNKTLTAPTIADLTSMTHDHTSAAEGGDEAWADMTQAATQADVAASTSHTIADTAETVDRSDIEAKLDALGTEINKINDLIDKLQAANLMS